MVTLTLNLLAPPYLDLKVHLDPDLFIALKLQTFMWIVLFFLFFILTLNWPLNIDFDLQVTFTQTFYLWLLLRCFLTTWPYLGIYQWVDHNTDLDFKILTTIMTMNPQWPWPWFDIWLFILTLSISLTLALLLTLTSWPWLCFWHKHNTRP